MNFLTFLLVGAFIIAISSSAYAMGTDIRFEHLYEAELATGIYFEEAPFETLPDHDAEIYASDGMITIVYKCADGEEITARKYTGSSELPEGEQSTVYTSGHMITLVNAPLDDGILAAAWSTENGSYTLTSNKPLSAERMQQIAGEMIR